MTTKLIFEGDLGGGLAVDGGKVVVKVDGTTIGRNAAGELESLSGGGTVPNASLTEAGIVNLTAGQVLGAGSKVIDGVTIKGEIGVIRLSHSGAEVNHSVAIGNGAFAYQGTETNATSVAIGNEGTAAAGISSVAIGPMALAFGNYGVCIGTGQADEQAVAIGGAMAGSPGLVGNPAVYGKGSISIGSGASSTTAPLGLVDISGIAIGKSAVSGAGGIAIGQAANAMNTTAMALGLNSIADNAGTAIGSGAQSLSSSGLAVGLYATTNHESNALGNGAVTTKNYQTVIGRIQPGLGGNTEYVLQGSLSFDGSGNGGEPGHIFTSNGNDVSPSWGPLVIPDASVTQAGGVNLNNGQVLGMGAKVIDGIRIGNISRGDASIPEYIPNTTAPTNISITNDPVSGENNVGAVGTDSVVIGINSKGDFSTVVVGNKANGIEGAVAIGRQAHANQSSVVIGYDAASYNTVGISGAVVLGRNAKSGTVFNGGPDGSVVIGGGAHVAITGVVATVGFTVVGANARAGEVTFGDSAVDNSTAMGYNANAQGTNSTAVGANSQTTKDNQVVLGAFNTQEVLTYGTSKAKTFAGSGETLSNLNSNTLVVGSAEFFRRVNPGTWTDIVFDMTQMEPVNMASEPSFRCYSFVLQLSDGGSSFTWPANVSWENGTPPVLSTAGIDLLGFIWNGDIFHGVLLSKNSTL